MNLIQLYLLFAFFIFLILVVIFKDRIIEKYLKPKKQPKKKVVFAKGVKEYSKGKDFWEEIKKAVRENPKTFINITVGTIGFWIIFGMIRKVFGAMKEVAVTTTSTTTTTLMNATDLTQAIGGVPIKFMNIMIIGVIVSIVSMVIGKFNRI